MQVQQQEILHRTPRPPPRDPLPSALLAELRRRFPPRRAAYIARVLTAGELGVISDLCDALILARIKQMPRRRLARFDALVPRQGEHQAYHALQMQWLRDEEYLLQTRLGRRPTHKELLIDFMNHDNGLRFRAYFALKFPHKMKPATPRDRAAI